MVQKHILLLCGGGSSEHDISLLSANYLQSNLQEAGYQVLRLELQANGDYLTESKELAQISQQQVIFADGQSWAIDFVVPCIHGYPGETGDIQSYLELLQLPYLGCGSEASVNCFNKITAKMWFSALGIPNTPYLILAQNDQQAHQQALKAFETWGSVFVKAASQGSSVGCYKVDSSEQLAEAINQAFEFSPYVIVEQTIVARELEVAVYQYQGKVIATKPGEIVCASNTFYSFDEKYASDSQAVTHIEAPNLSQEISEQIQGYALKAFEGLKLRHLSRIDFFLTQDNQILLNEINTFPGMTPISMFPKMLINHGEDFKQVLQDQIESTLNADK